MLSNTKRIIQTVLKYYRLKSEIAINNSSHLTSFSKSLKPTLYCLTQALNVKIANILYFFIGFRLVYYTLYIRESKDYSPIMTHVLMDSLLSFHW